MLGLRAQIRFEDTAAKSGPKFTLRNGAIGEFHQPELMVGGVAALDYNNDGCMDIFFTNGAAMPSLKKTGPQYFNRLFRNDCHGGFVDVTDTAGVAGEGYSMAVAVGDYDNDGYPGYLRRRREPQLPVSQPRQRHLRRRHRKGAPGRRRSRITESCGRPRPPGWTWITTAGSTW
jgi:hypothetical protein